MELSNKIIEMLVEAQEKSKESNERFSHEEIMEEVKRTLAKKNEQETVHPIDSQVYIPSVSKKAVVKDYNSNTKQYKVTYFTRKKDKRITRWFDFDKVVTWKPKQKNGITVSDTSSENKTKYGMGAVLSDKGTALIFDGRKGTVLNKKDAKMIQEVSQSKNNLNEDEDDYENFLGQIIQALEKKGIKTNSAKVNGKLPNKYDLPTTLDDIMPRSPMKIIPLKLLEVKKLHSDAVIPSYQTEGASGFDLHALEDIYVEFGKTVLVKTGLSFEIPRGFEMQIRPRSGFSKKTKLRVSNSPATIDSDYRGDVGILIDNIGTELDGGYLIKKGDRIAQGVICPVERVFFLEVEDLSDTERGDGGFGHTGIE